MMTDTIIHEELVTRFPRREDKSVKKIYSRSIICLAAAPWPPAKYNIFSSDPAFIEVFTVTVSVALRQQQKMSFLQHPGWSFEISTSVIRSSLVLSSFDDFPQQHEQGPESVSRMMRFLSVTLYSSGSLQQTLTKHHCQQGLADNCSVPDHTTLLMFGLFGLFLCWRVSEG